MRDNVPWLPDSELSYTLSPTPAEAALQRVVTARWLGVRPVLGRFAAPFLGRDPELDDQIAG
jgi:hypothetical protein